MDASPPPTLTVKSRHSAGLRLKGAIMFSASDISWLKSRLQNEDLLPVALSEAAEIFLRRGMSVILDVSLLRDEEPRWRTLAAEVGADLRLEYPHISHVAL